nr:MAG TPA: hypothetical protein [Caudoviricetes sp.]
MGTARTRLQPPHVRITPIGGDRYLAGGQAAKRG